MNIFGEGLPEQIIKQVNVRQKTYGSGYADGFPRTPEQIVVLNANTGWIKLLSSVDIPDTTKINNPTIMGLGLSGNELAKRYILFNGTSRKNGSKTNMAEGITTTSDDRGEIEDQFSLATYGIGGTEFGLNPMMGITSISVNHENRGSLRRAVVKIKAYNKIQFEIIDVLYLRLGFQVLLEWGNSLYFNNNDYPSNPYEPLITNNFSLADKFLNGRGNVKNPPPDTGEQFKYFNYDDFLQHIHQNRLDSCGNYDAMFAKVTNFHWSVNKDGSYDIEVNLASIGDIIESLKVNVASKSIAIATKKAEKDEQEKVIEAQQPYLQAHNNTAIGEFLNFSVTKKTINSYTEFIKQYPWLLLDPLNALAQYTAYVIFADKNAAAGNLFYLQTTGGNREDTWASVKDLTNIRTTTKLNLQNFNSPEDRDFITVNWDNVLTGVEDGDPFSYVRLGAFLQFLQDVIVFQQNSSTLPNNHVPGLKFDYDVETNIMNAYDRQVSFDPKICVVNRNIGLNLNPDTKKYEPLTKYTYSFIPTDKGVKPPTTTTQDGGKYISDNLKTIGSYGKIMNIFVNCRFIMETIETNKDEKGEIVLIDFLQKILDGISEGLGGLNDLDVFIDETLNTVKIIDKNALQNKEAVLIFMASSANKKLFPYIHQSGSQEISYKDTVFQLFGYSGSSAIAGFVKDFTFKTELTPAFSTMITVGAAANATVVGEENTALSRINKGLIDRYKETIVNIIDPVKVKEELTKLDEAIKEYTELLKVRNEEFEKFLYDMSNTAEWYSNDEWNRFRWDGMEYNVEDIALHKTSLKEIIALEEKLKELIAKKAVKPKPITTRGNGFIPFNLALTMDGLSGMKINEKFTVNADFLPSNYPETVEFLIKNLTHEVANNKWTTKVDSYCIAKQPTDYMYVPPAATTTAVKSAPATPKPTPTTTTTTTTTTTGSVGDYSKTLTSGFFMEREIVSGMTNNGKWKVAGEPTIFTKSQIYLHHTAGWARMDQGKGTVDYWNSKAKYLRETIDPATGISILGTQNKTTGDWFVPSGAPYVIDGFGHVEQLADDRFFYITQGSRYFSNANQIGIGIEVCNPGYVEMISGKWTALSTDLQKYPSYLSGWLDKSKKFDVGNGISELVDENGTPTKYRTFNFGISYHPEQVKNLEALIRRLMSKYSIPFKWEGKKTYDQMFPKAATKLLDANKGVPGVYTHAIGGRKVDMMPNSEIITMLKKFT